MNRSKVNDQGNTSSGAHPAAGFDDFGLQQTDEGFADDFLDGGDIEFEAEEVADVVDPTDEFEAELPPDEPVESMAAPAMAPAAADLGGIATYVAAALCLGGGGALAALGTGGGALQSVMTRWGLAPAPVLLVGVVLLAVAGLRRRLHGQQQAAAHLHELSASVLEHFEHQSGQLGYLVDAEVSRADDDHHVAEDVQQAIHLIQRQDEKIANLTKATKMYGKPLLEITNQISDSGHQVTEVARTLNTVKVIIEQATGRLENAVRAGSRQTGAEDFDKIESALRRLDEAQRELSHRMIARSDALKDEVTEAGRRTLARVDKLREELDELLGSASKSMSSSLEERLTDGLRKTAEALSSDVGHLANAVRGTGEKVTTTLDKRLGDALREMAEKVTAGLQSLEQSAAAPAAGRSEAQDKELGDTLRAIRTEIESVGRGLAGLRDAHAATPAPSSGAAAAAKPASPPATAAGGATDVKSAIAKLRELRK